MEFAQRERERVEQVAIDFIDQKIGAMAGTLESSQSAVVNNKRLFIFAFIKLRAVHAVSTRRLMKKNFPLAKCLPARHIYLLL